MLTADTSSAYADTVLATEELEQQVRGADVDAGLRAVARLRELTGQLEAEQVAAARNSGWSWQDIAERLGVTKQTVHRKYHRQQEGR
jgi:DNA-directed RNA polymerase specialized sigma24 family protein